MTNIRDHIEVWFSRLGKLIYRRAWLFLALSLLVAGGMIAKMPAVKMDTSAEVLLHKKDPSLLIYKEFRNLFGRDQMMILGLEPPDVFDRAFLEKLKALHQAIEAEVKNLDEINSLANAVSIRGQEDDLIVEDLLEHVPANAIEMADFKKTVLEHPLYRGTIISKDGRFTIVTIKPVYYSTASLIEGGSKEHRKLSEEEVAEFVDDVKAVCSRFESPDFHVYVGGELPSVAVLQELTMETMSKFTTLTSLVIIVLMGFLFRRLSGVILPLLIVNAALFSTVGLMAIFDVTMTLNTTVLPSFLLAVGIGDSVHILAIFYHHHDIHHDKENAIAFALGHSGLAVVMTSMTTAGGLFSFVTAGIAPVAELGIFAAVGVLLALLFSVITLPALLAVTPIKEKKRETTHRSSRLDRFLAGIGDLATSHPWKIVAVSCVLLIVSLAFALQLKFTHNSLHYLPKDMSERLATEKIDKQMEGSLSVEVLVDTGKENGLYDPALLADIEKAQQLGEGLHIGSRPVAKSVSIVDTIKDMNRALHGGSFEFFKLPGDRELIAQELLLYEIGGGDNLRALVDSGYRRARITYTVPWVDAVVYSRVLAGFGKQLQDLFGDSAKVTVTGIVEIICRTFAAIITTMGSSYVIAGGVITIMMILLIGNFRIGLVSMFPNFLPIVMGLGFMKIVGVPLDYSTIMVGGIAIGLAVDDTVHFLHNFRRYYGKTGDAPLAVRETLTTTGRAMLFTTLILSGGFFILLWADLKSTFNFGLITGFTISMALLADFFLAPALMTLIAKWLPVQRLAQSIRKSNGEQFKRLFTDKK